MEPGARRVKAWTRPSQKELGAQKAELQAKIEEQAAQIKAQAAEIAELKAA